MGLAPTIGGVNASIQISGKSSLTGDFPVTLSEIVYNFSETCIDANQSQYYSSSQRLYCSGLVKLANILLIQRELIPLSDIYGPASRDSTVTLSLVFQIKVVTVSRHNHTNFAITGTSHK